MSKKVLTVLVVVLALALAAVGALLALEKGAGAQLSAEIESLNALAEARDAEIESLTADAAAKSAEIESLTADAAAKGAEIESLTADAAAKGAEIESLTADAAAKDAEIESLTADAAAKDAEIESLTAAAAAKDALIASLIADTEAKGAEIESLTADTEAKDAAIESLTADAEAKDAAIESLTADAEAKDAEIESLSADLEGKEAEVAGLNAAIEDLQAADVQPADVEEAFDATRFFLQACQDEGLRCEYHGADADGDDCISVELDGLIPCTARFWFSENSARVPFLVWQYIRFSAIDRAAVLELCNLLNKEYSDVTFLVDDWDNSVSVRGSMAFSNDSEQAAVDFEAFRHLLQILSENEEHFLPYAQ